MICLIVAWTNERKKRKKRKKEKERDMTNAPNNSIDLIDAGVIFFDSRIIIGLRSICYFIDGFVGVVDIDDKSGRIVLVRRNLCYSSNIQMLILNYY